VIVGNDIRGKVSSRISIGGYQYTIAGKLDPTRSEIDRTVFLRMDDAYTLAATEGVVPASAPRIHPGDINAVLIRIAPEPAWFRNTGTLDFRPSYVEFEKDVIRNQFEPAYATVIGRHLSLDPVSEEISGIPGLLGIISGVVVVAAFPLIALIAAMVAHERQREIGLLRSMGAKRRIVAFLVIAESLFLAAAGGIAGVTVSILVFALLNISGVLNSALMVSFRMPGMAEAGLTACIAVLGVIAIGGVASLYPAYQSSRMNPYDAIHREGN
jgi:putative ABC transport system permease protein